MLASSILLLAFSLSLVQGDPATTAANPDPEPFRVHLVGGALTGGDGVHSFGGIEAGWAPGRFGVQGTGLYGRGNGFSSTLVGAGPALRQPMGTAGTLVLWTGGGWYREGRSPGISRSLPVATGGVAFQFPAGPVRLTAGTTVLVGSYSSQTASNPIPVRSIRFTVGVGR
jgi:hypothetical protein